MKRKHFQTRAVGLLAALALLAGLLPVGALAAPGDAAETAGAGSVVGTAYSENENAYEIYPVPHSTVTAKGTSFTLTADVNVVVGQGVDTYTTDFLRALLTRFGHTMTTSAETVSGKSNIVLAIHGSDDPITPAAYPDLFTAADKFDPYLLRAEASSGNQNGVITIVGKNADCVYYGVATLQMMFTSFNGEKFLPVQIEDYSNTIFRGFVEGFYGPGFRSYADRESQMRAIRDVKGNMYVFAAKGDPYHGSRWSEMYPDDELADIQHLVEVGKETKVHYTWSVHIGLGKVLGNNGAEITDALYAERLTQLQAKFQQLYDVGVRSFNILNDDYNSGTYARQVQLLNDMNAWLKEKGDCMPLIYCCAGYNIAWAGNGAELTALAALEDDIYLYWTGADVNTPITQENVTWPYERAHQPIVGWLNYPCSEHSGGRGIFLGNIRHYVKDADGLTGHYGLLSNGMASPEANKVAYFQLMSWAWNRDNYTSYLDDLWEDSFKYLQPEVYDAYLTIARNVSNCPNSGRIPDGFPESEYIKDALEAVQASLLAGTPLADIPEAQDLLDELDNILSAIADFRASCENSALKAELEPWLKSLTDVVTAAISGIRAADELAYQDVSAAWSHFSTGAVALGKWNTYPSSNPDVSNNVKAGSLRLQPFASALLSYVETAMAQQFNPGGIEGTQSFYAVLHGVKRGDDTNSAKIFDGDPTTVASYHDGTGGQQQKDDYYGVDLGAVKLISAVDILQGNSDTDQDYFHKASLEYSVDGENWSTLVSRVNSRHIHVDGLEVAARYVRLRLLEKGYGTKQDYWTHIREFTVTEKPAQLLYTNAANVLAQEETSGGAHTLTVSAATLAAGEYVGIRLPSLVGIQTITTAGTLPSGVTLEWSVNGQTWTAGAPSQTTLMGYVRLRAASAVTLENVTLTACEPVQTDLTYVSSGPQIGLWSGSWSDLVDGDRSTQLYTNGSQTAGQYIIVDLGARQPVRDITLYFAETSDCPHNLSISLGDTTDPDGTWTAIASFTDADKAISPPYGTFACNANGQIGRYLKLQVTADSNQWMKLNELEVNTTVPQEQPLTAETATSGEATAASDGDLLTFFAPDAGEAGSWTKFLQAPTTFTSVTVLRGVDGATAAVEVEQNNAWKQVGALTESATTLQLSETGAITGLRLRWAADDVPAIAEVILSGAALPAGDAPTLYPNIYEQPAAVDGVTVANGTAVENLPLPETVTVTTSAGVTAEAPVTWTCEDYVPTAAGNYTFLGVPGSATLTNPGCFTLTATVTVQPASTAQPTTGNLARDRTAYASGREVSSQSPAEAVDNNTGTWWSGNKMKQKDNSTKFNTITDAVSWITVDLGAGVTAITQIQMTYNAKVWPLEYYVQVGSSAISYDGYTTPSIDTSSSTSDTTDVTYSAGYVGTMHALDAAGWTTIYQGTRTAGDTTNPTITLGDGGDAFTSSVPADARYLRLYFTQINPNALGGTGIGLKELTVNGTRAPADPNVASVAPAAAKGVQGDAWEELSLPTHVVATLEDNTTTRVAVTWDSTGYNANTTAPQTFTGTLTLPGGITNTGNVTATLTVTLSAPPTVVGYTLTPDRVTAPYGTAFADLGLTPEAVVQFSNGETRTLSVTWDESSYDPAILGDQDVSGVVALPWGGNTLAVTIPVNLTPILSNRVTLDQTSLTLYANESHASHTAALTATVGPDNATDKTVTWRTSDISVAAVNAGGTVTAMGVGTATITATAHDGSRASATCTVTVKEALGGSVSIAKPSADADYYFGAALSAALNQLTPQAAQDTLTYTWKRGSETVGTQATYTPVQADILQSLTLTVTAADPYEGSVTSAPVTVQKAPGLRLQVTLKSVACTTSDNNDGKITGLDANVLYEYKPSSAGDSAWTPVDAGSTEITGLDNGSYHVRRAATATHAPGPYTSVTVAAYGVVTYHVSIPELTGGGISADNTAPAQGATVTLTVTPDAGHRLTEDSLTVTAESGADIALTPVAGEENQFTFSMPAEDVAVSAEFEKLTYTIVHALENISCNMEGEHSHTVEYNDTPTIILRPDTGYTLPPTLKVYTKASVDADPEHPAEFNGYTYRPNSDGTATITFSSGITQDVVVSGAGVVKTYTIDHQLTDISCNVGTQEQHKVAHGAALTIQLTAAQGYYLPEQVTITMSGAAFADFEYTRTSDTQGQIAIAEGKITGPLVIEAAGAIPLTSVTVTGIAQVGQALTAQVRPSAATVSYQWYRVTGEGEEAIENATAASYTLTAADLNATVKVTVTGTAGYIGTQTSAAVGPVIPAPVDKSALQSAYDAAVEVEDAGYTAASWEAFQQAISNALTVLENADATQEEVDAAAAALASAQKGLKKPGAPAVPAAPVVTDPEPTTETKENEDGTTTTTVTEPDGTVTVTTTDENGEVLAEVKVPGTIPESDKHFEDVPVGHWADKAIHQLAAIEVVNGVTDTTYSPVAPMKRGDLATVLYRLSNKPAGGELSFEDVPESKYYAEGIAWAAKVGVVEGFTEEEFQPETVITREQLALMLLRYAKLLGMDTNADAEVLEAFADGSATHAWGVEGMAWCVKNGILQGRSEDTLAPTSNVTRAEVAVMLDRFLGLIK